MSRGREAGGATESTSAPPAGAPSGAVTAESKLAIQRGI